MGFNLKLKQENSLLLNRVLLFFVLTIFLSKCNLIYGLDHDNLAREVGCVKCHTTIPSQLVAKQIVASTSLQLRENSSKWCLTCHSMENGSHHPTGINVKNKVNLPMEPNNRMDCLTCHNPHISGIASTAWVPKFVSRSKNGIFKTHYLNVPNTQGQLCKTCHKNQELEYTANAQKKSTFDNHGYAGSESCKACHLDIYRMWKTTTHAKMVRPFKSVNAIENIPVEQLNWPVEKIEYTLGSHYVKRFVARASGTLVVLPKIWDSAKKSWLPVFDHGWRSRNWLKQCAGCHTTGFSTENDTFIEPGIGCESCHGPALNHTRTGSAKYVVSPSKLTPKRREMICMSCHTSGIDNAATHQFPSGYKPGDDLTKFYSGLTPKPGQTVDNFAGDESYEDRERQWQFLKDNLFLAQGLTCDYCQNFRNFETEGNKKYLTKAEYCLTCHLDMANHPKDAPGKNCTMCHIPAKNASGAISIHDHKFTFD